MSLFQLFLTCLHICLYYGVEVEEILLLLVLKKSHFNEKMEGIVWTVLTLVEYFPFTVISGITF